MRELGVAVLLAWITAACSMCTDVCPTNGTGWNSNLTAIEIGPTYVVVEWSPDTSANYSVKWYDKGQDNRGTFVSSQTTTAQRFTIPSLMENLNYEVEVCRAVVQNTDDDCGRCLLCVSTPSIPGPPDPPSGVMLQVSGPETITVSWPTEDDDVLMYHVLCVQSSSREVIVNSSQNRVPSRTTDSLTNFDFSPDTKYNCSVAASNVNGIGDYSVVVQATTRSRTTDPGLLLMIFEDGIYYAKVTETSVTQSSTYDERMLLFSTPSTAVGLDYHFYREEVYYTSANGSLIRENVTFDNENNELSLVPGSGPEVLLSNLSVDSLGSVAVDWIYDEIYWLEYNGIATRIMRGVLSDAGLLGPYCVVEFPIKVGHIIIDPVRGFFFWNDENGLYRAPASSVRVNASICSNELTDTEVLIQGEIIFFTLESNQIYVYRARECISNFNYSLSVANLDGRSIQDYIASSVREVPSIASFTLRSFFATSDRIIISNELTTPLVCGGNIGSVISVQNVASTGLRMYRSAQQPLPAPSFSVMTVRVSPSNTEATISWSAPLFTGTLFSPSAFNEWKYIVEYRQLAGAGSWTDQSTFSLSLVLDNLQPGTLYEFDVVARGLGGETRLESSLVFTTRTEANLQLLVATQTGVIRTDTTGETVQCVGRDGSIGVTHDSYADTTYWAADGSQGEIVLFTEEGVTILTDKARDPFSVRLDWVTRRLFWVEEGTLVGSNAIVSLSVAGGETNANIEVFQPSSSTVSIEATALDALNGFLFWVSDTTINRKTLSGIEQSVCHDTTPAPTALAVDPERQRLYWLSNPVGGGALTVNQLEYSTTDCTQGIQARELPHISFSSSATVLAYASDTLFIGNRISNEIFSIPSNFPSVPSDQQFAVNSLRLGSVCDPGRTVSVRDIAFTSVNEQRLPNGVTAVQRGLSIVTPVQLISSPSLGDTSTTTTIVLEWESSPPVIPNSPRLYLVNYLLNGVAAPPRSVVEMTMLELTGQEASTTVISSVIPCSVWNCGPSTPNSTLVSPPDIPGMVTNVRVFAYRPLANEDVFSALVLWDAPADSVVSTYSVTLTRGGAEVSDVYQPTGDETYHTLIQRNSGTLQVSYFDAGSSQYSIQIRAANPTGPGPQSTPFTFDFMGPSYPRQVLALNSGGAQVVGMETNFVTPPMSVASSRLVAVDTITREVFYYSSMFANSIIKSSLQGGDVDALVFINNSEELLAMAYDWVARELYYAIKNLGDNNLQLFKISIVNKNKSTRLFPGLSHSVPESASIQLTVDPTRGFLYWEQSDGGLVQLHSLNLRVTSSTATTVLGTSSRRRKRQAGTLASLNLTPVLSLDSVTGALLVASTTGDIYSCDVSTKQCEVLVNATALSSSPSTIGLPPTSIAVDERHIYWANEGAAGVYAVERTDTSTLIQVSTENISSLFGLSPGSQPLGPLNCLSPDFREQSTRPRASVQEVTSTTVTLEWNEPMLPSECANVTFSFPPLTYEIFLSSSLNPFLMMFTGRTLDTQFTVEGLQSFFEYSFNVAAFNVFSVRRDMFDNLRGLDTSAMTTEGVPDKPINLNFIVLGTSTVELTWLRGDLRGPADNVMYYIHTASGQVTAVSANATVNSSNGIIPGRLQDIRVFTSNGVFNSTAARVMVPFWPLAPAPNDIMSTNSSFSLSVELMLPLHEEIRGVALQHCLASLAVMGNDTCSCPNPGNRTAILEPPPVIFDFSVVNLTAFTGYCLQSVGRYTQVGDIAETTPGLGVIRRTSEGFPEAPVVTLNGQILSWSPPLPRSNEGITSYHITAKEVVFGPRNASDEVLDSPVNLQTRETLELEVDVFYDVTVRAENNIGIGPPSNSVEFRREPGSILTAGPIAAIAVGGFLLILFICFILFCVWFIRLGRPKEQEIRSLSYMYGPDHELSNLRDAYRHTQSANPHYTWTCEDYVCTDEDLDLLSKFPRHNLKLENFIDRGEFGEVYQGTAIDILGADTGPTPVAVKTLRKGAGIEDSRKFLSEASLMSNFNHPNIVKVLGVCLDNDPVYIIMELMPAGDLLKFLREAKRDHGPALLTLSEQIQVSLDVAHGCRYLEQQHFIHRDIAARNCLVSSKGADRVVKIGDFGLARDLYSSDYYQVEGQRKLPVRWMAPEALLQGKFAVESDIWSFGVLLWEIMSLGNQPYPGRINQEVLQFVTGGGRLDKPDKCPTKLYHLMQNCWKRYASDRPHFEQIVTILTNFLDRIKRPDSVYHSDSDSDIGGEDSNVPKRQNSTKTPTRSPSFKSGFMNLARSGSVKLRNSFRRHGSIHKREENTISQLPEDSNDFRERGPF